MLRLFPTSLLALALVLAVGPLAAEDNDSNPARAAYESLSGEEALEHIKYLASEELEGRDTGSKGERATAEYVARHFEEWGLEPVGDEGSYFQYFSIGSSQGLGEKNSIIARLRGGKVEFEVEKDFHPFGFSENGTVKA